eukprot:CAMPEP_0181098790 /NCGR_PEP_ID=MMETSP1071-20121207/12318_1 /TAXON_ID=35127 /ORGANISM="Thalassiosira sp., Strain NH16" /LENGTH=630 /DNA_ID=CAMNT_0023181417 /DNA_START=122 /DNA_END=2010 /DNA_ORIENTATION=+
MKLNIAYSVFISSMATQFQFAAASTGDVPGESRESVSYGKLFTEDDLGIPRTTKNDIIQKKIQVAVQQLRGTPTMNQKPHKDRALNGSENERTCSDTSGCQFIGSCMRPTEFDTCQNLKDSDSVIGEGSCNGYWACKQLSKGGVVGAGSCTDHLSCMFLRANVGAGSCTDVESCVSLSGVDPNGALGLVGAESCTGSGSCTVLRGNVGEKSCTASGSCWDFEGIVGDKSCTGSQSCTGIKANVGNGSCLGSASCISLEGEVGDGSCTQFSSCRGVKGKVGSNSCTESSFESPGGWVGGCAGYIGDIPDNCPTVHDPPQSKMLPVTEAFPVAKRYAIFKTFPGTVFEALPVAVSEALTGSKRCAVSEAFPVAIHEAFPVTIPGAFPVAKRYAISKTFPVTVFEALPVVETLTGAKRCALSEAFPIAIHEAFPVTVPETFPVAVFEAFPGAERCALPVAERCALLKAFPVALPVADRCAFPKAFPSADRCALSGAICNLYGNSKIIAAKYKIIFNAVCETFDCTTAETTGNAVKKLEASDPVAASVLQSITSVQNQNQLEPVNIPILASLTWYPDWIGKSGKCLNDGNAPSYMMTTGNFLETNQKDCCDKHYKYDFAACMGKSSTVALGYYP